MQLKDQMDTLRRRADHLEAHQLRSASLVRDSKSSLQAASRERDELRHRLDEVVLDMEEKHPASLLDALGDGRTTVEELEAAKLRRGVRTMQCGRGEWVVCRGAAAAGDHRDAAANTGRDGESTRGSQPAQLRL